LEPVELPLPLPVPLPVPVAVVAVDEVFPVAVVAVELVDEVLLPVSEPVELEPVELEPEAELDLVAELLPELLLTATVPLP